MGEALFLDVSKSTVQKYQIDRNLAQVKVLLFFLFEIEIVQQTIARTQPYSTTTVFFKEPNLYAGLLVVSIYLAKSRCPPPPPPPSPAR